MIRFSGQTMGSHWHAHIAIEQMSRSVYLTIQAAIEFVLTQVNAQMSTYIPESEIEQFNRQHSTARVPISPEMRLVLSQALRICEQTNGRYDVTVGGLVNAWGFGADRQQTLPDTAEIQTLLKHVDWQQLDLNEQGLSKKDPQLRLDLCSIAKGYGVDKVALLLDHFGFHDYIVEIGGETRVSGSRFGQVWRVGVERPQWGGGALSHLLGFSHVRMGLAASGHYKNFKALSDQQMISHEIDTRTGRTVVSSLLSTVVLAEDCMTADGYATALLLLGEDALEFAQHHRLAAMLIDYDPQSPTQQRLILSEAFENLLRTERLHLY